jgi:O-antigen ligase
VLSLLIETGIPGLIFFAGSLLLSIWYCLRSYLSDMSESSAVYGAVACSLVAFTTNRLVLSQKENHMLIFSLLAIVVVLNYQYGRKRVSDPVSRKPIDFTTVPLKAGTNGAADKRPSAGRSAADENRREALAARMATLILAALILFFLLTCVHMFSHWL